MAILKEDVRRLEEIFMSLRQQRAPLVNMWRDIGKNIDPFYGDMNEDERSPQLTLPTLKELKDGTVAYYSHVFASGLNGYACSSKSDFFALRAADNELAEDETVTKELQARQRAMYKTFTSSGFYTAILPFFRAYGDLGTGVMMMGVKDNRIYYENVRPDQCQALKDPYTGDVEVFFRSIWLTKYDAEKSYGSDKLPEDIKKEKDPLKYFRFIQMIAPRDRFDFLDVSENGYRYLEVVWAYGLTADPVFVGGDDYRRFAVCPWNGQDTGIPDFAWGTGSPGQRQYIAAHALTTNLQDQWKSARLQALSPIKKTENVIADIRPGGFIDIPAGGDISPLQLGSDLSWTLATSQKLNAMAKADYFVDFFLMLSQYQGNVNTATLAQGLQNEQVNMMTTMLDCLARSFFKPVIEYTYYKMQEIGKFAPPEVNLDFSEIEIDYISPLYLLQLQSVVIQPTTSLMADVLQMANIDRTILHYIDMPKYLKIKADATNADRRIIRTEQEAQETIRMMNELNQQAAAQQLAIEKQKADAQTTAANAKAEQVEQNKTQQASKFAGMTLR